MEVLQGLRSIARCRSDSKSWLGVNDKSKKVLRASFRFRPATRLSMGSSQSTPAAAAETTAPPAAPVPATPAPLRRRTFDQLVEEELPIQRASVAMEGGAPTCMTLFDDFFSCFCTSAALSRRSPLSRASLTPSLPRAQLSGHKPVTSTDTATPAIALPNSTRSNSACR